MPLARNKSVSSVGGLILSVKRKSAYHVWMGTMPCVYGDLVHVRGLNGGSIPEVSEEV